MSKLVQGVIVVLILCTIGCKKLDQSATGKEIRPNDLLLSEVMSATRSSDYAKTQALAAAVRVHQCTDSLAEKTQFHLEVFRGLVVDGAWGDACSIASTASWCGIEGLRAAVSFQPGGSQILNAFGQDSTQQKAQKAADAVASAARKTGFYYLFKGREFEGYVKKILNDERFRQEQALQITTLVGITLGDSLGAVAASDCEPIRRELGKVVGLIGYEAITTLGAGVFTLPAGGTGAYLKIGQVIAKLNETLKYAPNVSKAWIQKIINGLNKLSTDIADLKYRKSVDQAQDGLKTSGRIPCASKLALADGLCNLRIGSDYTIYYKTKDGKTFKVYGKVVDESEDTYLVEFAPQKWATIDKNSIDYQRSRTGNTKVETQAGVSPNAKNLRIVNPTIPLKEVQDKLPQTTIPRTQVLDNKGKIVDSRRYDSGEIPYSYPSDMKTYDEVTKMSPRDFEENVRYIFVIDRRGKLRIAKEKQPGKTIKHGDLVPAVYDAEKQQFISSQSGNYRGYAKAGGEAILKKDGQGNFVLQMNIESSYSFARADLKDGVAYTLENQNLVQNFLAHCSTGQMAIEMIGPLVK
jgi:hypothetical protein